MVKLTKLIKVGIIGCGAIATQAQIPCFQRIKSTEISCISDVNSMTLRKVSKKYKIPKSFFDYRKLLEEELDLVSICTPGYTHAKLCIDAAKAKKNILVEKPLALSLKQAKDVGKAVRKNCVKLCVVHNYLFSPAIIRITEMYKTGELGKVLSTQAIYHIAVQRAREDYWRDDESKSGGPLIEYIHPIYLLAHFGEDLKSVHVTSRKVLENFNKISDIRAILTFGNDCIGYLEFLSFTSPELFLFNVYGTGASVRTNIFRNSYRINNPNQLEEIYHSIEDAKTAFKILAGKYDWFPHLFLIAKYVKSIKEDKEPPVTVEDGIKAVRIAEAIKEKIEALQIPRSH